jgi:hypothetical protein
MYVPSVSYFKRTRFNVDRHDVQIEMIMTANVGLIPHVVQQLSKHDP